MERLSRRSALQFGGAALAVGLAGCSRTVVSGRTYRESTDWPMHAHDATNSGFTPRASGPSSRPGIVWIVDVLPDTSSDPPTKRWRSTTPPTPILADGTVYIGGDGLFAIDAADGSVRWRAIDSEMTFGPAVIDETIYVASTELAEQAGHIRAFSPADGTVEWTTPYGRDLGTLRFGPLVATGEFLYASVAQDDTTGLLPDQGRLVTLNRATGERQWSAETVRQADHITSPGVDEGVVFIGGPDISHFQALGPNCSLRCQYLGESPTRQWTSSEEVYYPVTAPTVTDELVYIGGWGHHWKAHTSNPYNHLSAFSRADGTVRWRRKLGDQVTSPAVVNGTSYVAATRSTGTEPYEDVNAVRIETDVVVASFDNAGTERWSQTLSDRRVWAAPVVADGIVYVGTYASQTSDAAPAIHALTTQSGELLWKRELPAMVNSLAVGDSRLYASGWDGLVMALE